MLQASHVCPSCGQTHVGRKFGLKHRAPRECPLVVVGNFPIVSLPNPPIQSVVKVTTGRRSPQFGLPADPELLTIDPLTPVQSARAHETERRGGLGLPWLPPPDLGEVL